MSWAASLGRGVRLSPASTIDNFHLRATRRQAFLRLQPDWGLIILFRIGTLFVSLPGESRYLRDWGMLLQGRDQFFKVKINVAGTHAGDLILNSLIVNSWSPQDVSTRVANVSLKLYGTMFVISAVPSILLNMSPTPSSPKGSRRPWRFLRATKTTLCGFNPSDSVSALSAV